jgi:peptidoglycan/LPS O-acetylase OafA/YrhL
VKVWQRFRSLAKPQPKRNLRPDIQGLRAVAVGLVVFNHVHLAGTAGGYVGVDVFFVISGYLITQLLMNGARRDGEVSLGGFYSRRARRILPAATLTIVVTDIAARYLANYVRAQDALHDSVWASLFMANIRFAQKGANYFQSPDPSPFQHYWSLAVEEQFYLVWPLIIGLVLFFAKRAAGSSTPRFLGHGEVTERRVWLLRLVLGMAIVGSISWSVHDTSTSPAYAYFSALTRAYELGIGALLAVSQSWFTRLPVFLRAPLSWIGLAAIVVATVTFDGATAFPGYAALLPVLGTAAVIAAGIPGIARGSAGWALSWRPFTYLGDISYSLYLWHWPILILGAEYEGHGLSVLTNLLLAAGAVALASLTYHTFENPLRSDNRILGSKSLDALVAWPASLAAVLVVGVFLLGSIRAEVASAVRPLPQLRIGHSSSEPVVTRSVIVKNVQAAVSDAQKAAPIPPLATPIADLAHDLFPLGDCDAGGGVTSKICHYGDVHSKTTVVLIGDSHARMWLPALVPIAQRLSIQLIPFIHSGCPVYQDAVLTSGKCAEWYAWASRQIAAIQPSMAIYSNATNVDLQAPQSNSWTNWSRGSADVLNKMKSITHDVVFLGDAPPLPQDPTDCLLARHATMKTCTFPEDSNIRLLNRQAQSVAAGTRSVFVPTTSWFCARGECPSVIGGAVAYIDTTHVSATCASAPASPTPVGGVTTFHSCGDVLRVCQAADGHYAGGAQGTTQGRDLARRECCDRRRLARCEGRCQGRGYGGATSRVHPIGTSSNCWCVVLGQQLPQ